jgi:hypothetical protein
VAGIPAISDALVSVPASKHPIVALTVSSEKPKSSAFRTIRISRFCSSAVR